MENELELLNRLIAERNQLQKDFVMIGVSNMYDENWNQSQEFAKKHSEFQDKIAAIDAEIVEITEKNNMLLIPLYVIEAVDKDSINFKIENLKKALH